MLFANTVVVTVPIPAQSGGMSPNVWDGPYVWFTNDRDANGNPYDRHFSEISHAALIGKPGSNQGKVVMWRAKTNGVSYAIVLWNPAYPSVVTEADPPPRQVGHNIFCSCHVFDANGDLIIGGGDFDLREAPCSSDEPNWSFTLDPNNLQSANIAWNQTPDMLVPPAAPPGRWGHYYSSLVAMHDGSVIGVGGTSAPWDQATCGDHPLGEQANAPTPSNWWQRFDKTHPPHGRWEGVVQGAPGDEPYAGLPGSEKFHVYPLTHLLRSGRVFASLCPGAGNVGGRVSSSSALLDVSLNWPPLLGTYSPWSVHPSRLSNSAGVVDLHYASGILWPITLGAGPTVDQVVVFGGWDTNEDVNYNANNLPIPGSPAEARVYRISSPELATSSWVSPAGWGTLIHRRVYTNAVILPNLQLVLLGGSSNEFKPYKGLANYPNRAPTDEADPLPVYVPEYRDLLSPSSGWQVDEPQPSARLYHSIALLLPDGRVLSAGGYRGKPPNVLLLGLPTSDADIYNPPYLRTELVRPSIDSSSSVLTYGDCPSVKVSIPGFSDQAAGQEIEFATLIRCASVTHHFDWDQRCIKLEVLQVDDDQLTLAQIPTGNAGRLAVPPGMYMLHVVRRMPAVGSQVRVPSVARFVKVQ